MLNLNKLNLDVGVEIFDLMNIDYKKFHTQTL